MCFDAACQAAADRAFALAVLTPLVVFFAALAYIYRPIKEGDKVLDNTFTDPKTGIVYELPPGSAAKPETDRRGQLAYRVAGYTPWPVEEGYEGERVRVRVGPVRSLAERDFVFRKLLPRSKLVCVTLPRPLGVCFDEDKPRRRAVVGELTEGGNAEQRFKVAKLGQRLDDALAVGDVLRGCTCTNFVFEGSQLWGAKPPTRTIVMYCADGQAWPQVTAALRKGDAGDGPVTLVLERRLAAGEE